MTRLEALKDLKAKVEAGGEMSWRDFWPVSKDQPAIDARRAYDGSLDAAKALHEAVLPGWEYDIDSVSGVCVYPEDFEGTQVSVSNTTARAWLLAVLAALISQEEQQ
jgi:hypothetical protein